MEKNSLAPMKVFGNKYGKCTMLVLCGYKVCMKVTKGTLGVIIISFINLVAGLIH